MMRIDSIIQELNTKIADHVRIAEGTHLATIHDKNMFAVRVLRSAIILIESYRTKDED